ncbi:hypothetical protein GUJ93_ZPchr0012g19746 [Zizania palustris]|uniref:Uncharacterized protein n=1 Tax=Zizania palustris TaxID=103762 RepID=A0A8J5WSI1_ZIZPA|nr:hypothetical protein GUJ93_ZPchr0012g19746 [Zizania palustris]
MDKAGGNQGGKLLKKGKKKHAKDELDRQKQAEKKRRRLEKALANSAAIISELEKKRQQKKEEQQRLDDEGAAIAEAVALHVLIDEDSEESTDLMLNNLRICNHWEDFVGFGFTPGSQGGHTCPSSGPTCASYVHVPQWRWIDWGMPQTFSSWEQLTDYEAALYQDTLHQSDIHPGPIAGGSPLQKRREHTIPIRGETTTASSATDSAQWNQQ